MMNQPAATPIEGAAPTAKVFPITYIDGNKVMPRRYVLHKHSTFCKNCQTSHEYPQLYAFREAMSRTGAGKPVIHLVPVQSIEYNLPVEVITINPRIVPMCHECVGSFDFSARPDPRSWEEWQRTYCYVPTSALRASGTTPPPRKASAKSPKTIDDLL